MEIPEEFDKEQARKLRMQASQYIVRGGVLYRKNKQVPNQPLRVLQRSQVPLILQAMHDDPVAGHLGTYPVDLNDEERYESLVLARTMKLIDELFEARVRARENIRKSQERQKQYHDQQHPLPSFEIGDKVLRYRAKLGQQLGGKLKEKWMGPYWIHDVMGNGTYKLRTMGPRGKVTKEHVHGKTTEKEMEQRLETLRRTIQQLVDRMNPEEELEIKGTRVTLRNQDQEIGETFGRTTKKSKAQQIHDDMHLYLRDLDRPVGFGPVLPVEVAGATWNEKLIQACDDVENLNPRAQFNAHVLETYYKVGSLLFEFGWGDEARKRLAQQLPGSKGSLVWKIAKRTYLLFSTRGEY
ncbi:4842_t:CDS:2, partial [Ambispora leptoticha]